jgi:hypothetical protein
MFEAAKQRTISFLADRSKALLAGDEAGWLAGIDPTKTATVEHERMRYRNLVQLRPTTYHLLLGGDDPVGGAAGKGYPAGATLHKIKVVAIEQFDGDASISRQTYDYSIVRDGDKTTIVETVPAHAVDNVGVHDAPWDLVPLTSTRAAGVTVLAPADSQWKPASYIGPAKKASDVVRGVWQGRPATSNYIVFLTNTEQKNTWFGGASVPGDTLAVTAPARIVTPTGALKVTIPPDRGKPPAEALAGQRIMLDLQRTNPTAVAAVLTHEMGHAIAQNLIPPVMYGGKDARWDPPIWAIEGFAEWTSSIGAGTVSEIGTFVKSHWSQYHPAGDLPDNAGFYSTDKDRTYFNYEIGALFFAAADKTAGRQKAVDLYVYLVLQPSGDTTDRMFVDVALQKVGVTSSKFWSTFASLRQ